MTFEEREQITKKNSDDLLSQLIDYQGENLISEILRLGIQNLMCLVFEFHLPVGISSGYISLPICFCYSKLPVRQYLQF